MKVLRLFGIVFVGLVLLVAVVLDSLVIPAPFFALNAWMNDFWGPSVEGLAAEIEYIGPERIKKEAQQLCAGTAREELSQRPTILGT